MKTDVEAVDDTDNEEVDNAEETASDAEPTEADLTLAAEGPIDLEPTDDDFEDEEEIVELDEDKKAAMVSNLLVVLCADEAAQPVVNTDTLNH